MKFLAETTLDLRLLTRGAFAYGGVLLIEWLRMTMLNIPASVAVVPISILTGLGIVATVRGLIGKGEGNSSRAALLMVSGLILGVSGGIELLDAALDYEHTVNVCADSKVILDPKAQWACPQVLASYWLQWPLAVGLLIPAVLFLLVPLFDVREEQRPQRASPEQVREQLPP